MNCQICGEKPKFIWTNKAKGNGHSEPLFTNTKGQHVCVNCLTDREVNKYKGLQELNKQRKNEKQN